MHATVAAGFGMPLLRCDLVYSLYMSRVQHTSPIRCLYHLYIHIKSAAQLRMYMCYEVHHNCRGVYHCMRDIGKGVSYGNSRMGNGGRRACPWYSLVANMNDHSSWIWTVCRDKEKIDWLIA